MSIFTKRTKLESLESFKMRKHAKLERVNVNNPQMTVINNRQAQ